MLDPSAPCGPDRRGQRSAEQVVGEPVRLVRRGGAGGEELRVLGGIHDVRDFVLGLAAHGGEDAEVEFRPDDRRELEHRPDLRSEVVGSSVDDVDHGVG